MRDYSKVSPRFWTGDTGKQIRKLGRDCQVIAFYLFTCPSANMLGLYYLAMPTLCHETASPFKGALKALRSLQEAKFAYYDLPSEHVYVPNMAREQIGDRLKRKDNRHVAVVRELEQLRKTPFFNDFVARYREPFELYDIQIEPISGSPFEAPSKPLRSQEQEQEQEQNREGIAPTAPNGKHRPKTSKRCPPDFTPDTEFALAQLPDLDVETEIAKLKDWEFKTPRSDWSAVWRTWVRNAKTKGHYARKAGSTDPWH